jgi:hypothetical protein
LKRSQASDFILTHSGFLRLHSNMKTECQVNTDPSFWSFTFHFKPESQQDFVI